MQDSAGTAVYLSFLGGNLKLQSERSEDPAHMREAVQVFRRLTGIVEEADPLSRNLLALYKTLADLNMALGEKEEVCSSEVFFQNWINGFFGYFEGVT